MDERRRFPMTITVIIWALVALSLTAWLVVIPIDLVIGGFRALRHQSWKDFRQHH
jgi:hypothetical protein